MPYRKIPDETVRRLPAYLRGVRHPGHGGVARASSQELADLIGVEPWQIRKDFSYFGGFGKPGVGYDLRTLISRINQILRLDTGWKAALVGVGTLGSVQDWPEKGWCARRGHGLAGSSPCTLPGRRR